MEPDDTAPGMALKCDHGGVVLQVMHNDFGIPDTDLLRRPFPMLVARSSFQKALTFWAELKTKRSVFDWEFDVLVGGRMILTHCVGVAIDDGFLIIAAQSRSSVHELYDEMMRINRYQTDLLRSLTKEIAEQGRAPPERESKLYDELSTVNNELVTLQRELAKKNVELERVNAEVQRLAIVDDLTGLYNRRGFFEMGRREVARAGRFGSPLAAIMFDVDHFKRFNDNYGHATGDNVLKTVTARWSAQLREVDIIGRYGGEEFSVLLPETDLASARITAERLRLHTAKEGITTEHGLLTVTISLGVAVLKPGTSELEELLGCADVALYKAKASGRNCVCADGA